MCENGLSQEDLAKFWLHVPLEIYGGVIVQSPPSGRLSTLGHSAVLDKATLNTTVPGQSDNTTLTRYWLLFDPMSEEAARAVFLEMKLRLPILSFRSGTLFLVSGGDLHTCPGDANGIYNGPIPTLIPAEFQPTPVWAAGFSFTVLDAAQWLDAPLAECPAIEDERILTAIDLSIATFHETLPRSAFLAHLTVIDSLATSSDRHEDVQTWLDEKIKEAKKFLDNGLASSLGNLKQTSRGAAIRALIKRAGEATSIAPAEIAKMQGLAKELYRVRSALSHAGSSFELLYLGHAQRLANLIIRAVILHPAILNP